MINRFVIAVLCVLLGAAAAGEPELGRGLGGTGLTEADRGSGIGGTGHQPSGDGRGIGGTGIVGTIRSFGSIWVNGVEVHYWEDQPVTIYERPGTPRDLRVGQVVAVEARAQAGRLVAEAIEVRHAVVGPIAAVDGRAGTMQVLDQRIRMPQGHPLNGALRQGEWVAVSGLRDAKGIIVASHLERPPEGLEPFVRGHVERVNSSGVVIGGQRYALPAGVAPSAIPVGADLTLYGEPEVDTLRANRVRIGSELPFSGRVRNFLVEGFVDASGRRVAALTLPDTAYRPKTGERVVVQGRFGLDGSLESDSLRVLSAPSGLDRFRLRLEDLERDGAARRPARRPEAKERAKTLDSWRLPAPDSDAPTGLSPRPAPADDRATGGAGVDPWGSLYPGMADGFQAPGGFGAPGFSGGAGAVSGPGAAAGAAPGAGAGASSGPGGGRGGR
jgi:hypothetical protein